MWWFAVFLFVFRDVFSSAFFCVSFRMDDTAFRDDMQSHLDKFPHANMQK